MSRLEQLIPGASVRGLVAGTAAKVVQVEWFERVPDNVQRVVTENCQTLNFTSHGFERG
jgi:hypothetical protein